MQNESDKGGFFFHPFNNEGGKGGLLFTYLISLHTSDTDPARVTQTLAFLGA